jgi:hypothetical protein
VDRLGQLERTIVAISSSDEQSTGTDQSVVDSPSPDRNGELGNGREERGEKGVLTHDGFDAPYVNDVLLSRVLKAVRMIVLRRNREINVVFRNKM